MTTAAADRHPSDVGILPIGPPEPMGPRHERATDRSADLPSARSSFALAASWPRGALGLAVLGSVFVALTGCAADANLGTAPGDRLSHCPDGICRDDLEPEPTRDWTVLVYMAHDATTAAAGFDRDVYELALHGAGAGDGVEIVVQRDFGPGYESRPLGCSASPWTEGCGCNDCEAHEDCYALGCCTDRPDLAGCAEPTACALVDACFDACCIDGDCRCVDDDCSASACETLCRERHTDCDPVHEPFARERRHLASGPPTAPMSEVTSSAGTTTRRSQRFRIAGHSLETLEELDETNTGDAETLTAFLSWGAAAFPAKKYMVVVGGHGSSWDGVAFDSNPGGDGAAADDHVDGLALPELREALAAGAAAMGRPIDVLMFDACLMASMEVAWELRDTARYFVGSEEREPNSGHSYSFLHELVEHPGRWASTVARNVVYDYIHGYALSADSGSTDAQTTGHAPWGVSAVALDLSKLETLTFALRDLRDAILVSRPSGLSCPEIDVLAAGTRGFIDLEKARGATLNLDLYAVLAAIEDGEIDVDGGVWEAAARARALIGYSRDGYSPTDNAVTIRRARPGYVVFGTDGWRYNSNVEIVGSGSDGRGAIKRASVRSAALLGDGHPILPGYLMFPEEDGSYSLTLRPWTPGVRQFDYFVLDADAVQADFYHDGPNVFETVVPHAGMLAGAIHEGAYQRVRDYFLTSSFAERSSESPFVAEGHGQALAGFTNLHGLAIYFAANRSILGRPSQVRPNLTIREAYADTAFARDTGWLDAFACGR